MNEKTIVNLKSAFWFLVKLNLIAIPLFLISYLGLSFPPLQNVWAAALSQSLNSLGYETALGGNAVAAKVGGTSYQIDFSWDSTGWKSLYALVALVFASGVRTTRMKLGFLAFGLPLILFVNLLRVVTSSLILLNFGFDSFKTFHDILWEALMVIFVIGLWYFLFLKEKDNSR